MSQSRTPIGLVLGAMLALSAATAYGDDLASRAVLQRQQQSDAFALQLQQSLQSARSGSLTPQQRLEFDALQRDQRFRQDDAFYRQQIQRNTTPVAPGNEALRRAEALRFEQDRQQQLSRFRAESEPPAPPAARPAPLVDPGVATAPVTRRARPGMAASWLESAP